MAALPAEKIFFAARQLVVVTARTVESVCDRFYAAKTRHF